MNIAIIGASGFVGSSLVNEAIYRGYKVTAIARNTNNLPQSDSKLITPTSVNVYNSDKLVDVLRGHDAVLTSFHPGRGIPDEYDEYLKGHKAIQKAVKQVGIERWLLIGGAGSLYTESGDQLVDTAGFPEEFKKEATAARDYLNILEKESNLNWTYLSPAILMHPGINNGRTGNYRKNTDTPLFDKDGESKISVEDLAVALLDELENREFIQKRFTVGY